MAMEKQLACVVEDSMYGELLKLSEAEDRSIANILRRGARRELIEHQRSTQRLQNGQTRKAATAKKSSTTKRQLAAA